MDNKKELHLKDLPLGMDLIIPTKIIDTNLTGEEAQVAKNCNRIIYQSAQCYGVLDEKSCTKKQKEIIEEKYFKAIDENVLRNPKFRKLIFAELTRRFDIFTQRLDDRYSGIKGETTIKKIADTIIKHPTDYAFYLDKEICGEVQAFDAISAINRTLKYFDDLYEEKGIIMPEFRPFMDKYLKNPKVNLFLSKTSKININSRKKQVKTIYVDKENKSEEQTA